MGILANAFGLGYPIALAVAPQMVVVSVISLSASACFLVVWYLGIARRLFQLANRKPAEHLR
jgi:hypothetical protein